MSHDPVSSNRVRPMGTTDPTVPVVVYILFLLSYFMALVPAVIGVIIAHAAEGGASEPSRSHFRYQIRIFWTGFFILISPILLIPLWITMVPAMIIPVINAGAILTFIMSLGWLMIFPIAWFVYTLVMTIKGLIRAVNGEYA